MDPSTGLRFCLLREAIPGLHERLLELHKNTTHFLGAQAAMYNQPRRHGCYARRVLWPFILRT